LLDTTHLAVTPELIINIYGLYSDIIQFYGTHFRQKIRSISATQKLKDCIDRFNYEGMNVVKERFFNSLNSIGAM